MQLSIQDIVVMLACWLIILLYFSMGNHWPLIVALISVPDTFLLSNDAFYLGVLPLLNQVGIKYGFSSMDIAIASTAGQAFYLLSFLVITIIAHSIRRLAISTLFSWVKSATM